MVHKKAIAYSVSFAAFLGPFTQTVYVPILPELQDTLATSQLLINASISVFTFIIAFMQILYGPLTDTWGRKKVLLPGIALYVGASIGCFYADHIASLLFFRVFQAVGIATGSVVAVTVIGDLFRDEERLKAMGTFQMMVALGPVVGPVAGGFIADQLDYHYVFLALAVAGALIGILNLALLRETKPAGPARRIDMAEYARIARDRQGLTIGILGFVQFYIYYNFLVYLPVILDQGYTLSVAQKGLMFLPLSVALMLGSFLSSRVQKRLSTESLLVITALLCAVDVMAFLVTSMHSLASLIATTCLFGLLLGLSLPAQTALLTRVFVTHRATAVGLYNFFRFMGMACGPFLGALLFDLGGLTLLFSIAALLFLLIALLAHRNLMPVRRARA
ncbi:MFS transporter [Chromohalobacter sp.]|uniref:MFS transporter n=1 Tax=Chromohalobacter sp. TaxID=50740 RepID=UPI0032420614